MARNIPGKIADLEDLRAEELKQIAGGTPLGPRAGVWLGPERAHPAYNAQADKSSIRPGS